MGALFQSGAAILSAMLTVTLVATFAAAALWQQWRSVEIETAERARVQSGWILTGALDWGRLILREDARAGGADHLAEPWAVPLNEARLSSFLSVDKNASDTEREAFLSGQVIDLQARLNVANLVEGNALSAPAVASFSRLFESLGLPKEQLLTLADNLLEAYKSVVQIPPPPPAAAASAASAPESPSGAASAPAPMMRGTGSARLLQGSSGAGRTASVEAATPLTPLLPQRVEQLIWLGLTRETLAVLSPHITLLPTRTPVNLNTASALVISASTPGLDPVTAAATVAARNRSHFRTLAEANTQSGGGAESRFTDAQHSVSSRFFEVRGQLRLDLTSVEERSLVQRDGLAVTTLWRERGVVNESAASAGDPSATPSPRR